MIAQRLTYCIPGLALETETTFIVDGGACKITEPCKSAHNIGGVKLAKYGG